MMLRGIDFGPVCGASGVQGWFGEGYQFHRLWGPFGPRFDGMTFVAKTTTLHAREGNMALTEAPREGGWITGYPGWQPKRLVPKCVKVYPIKGMVLNSVGLSGPGAEALFGTRRWQLRDDPFFISFMSTEDSPEARLQELAEFRDLLKHYLQDMTMFSHNGTLRAHVGVQINFSCPNVGLKPEELTGEIQDALDLFDGIDAPIVPKFNAKIPVQIALATAEHRNCDAICVSNAMPWSTMFPDRKSPLEHLGGGGVSGTPIFPRVVSWLESARAEGLSVPLNIGGGIMSRRDVLALCQAGLDFSRDSIFLGSIAILRPWRVAGVIKLAHSLKKMHKHPDS